MSSSSSAASSSSGGGTGAVTKHPTQIYKETIALFFKYFLQHVLPRPLAETGEGAKMPSFQWPMSKQQPDKLAPIVYHIDTAALQLLHPKTDALTTQRFKRQYVDLDYWLLNKDKDARTTGSYIQRTVDFEREVVFRFCFLDSEVDTVSRGQAVTTTGLVHDHVAYTSVYIVLSPYLLARSANTEFADSMSTATRKLAERYRITHLPTNDLVCTLINKWPFSDLVARVVRCRHVVLSYQHSIPSLTLSDVKTVAQLTVERRSQLHSTLMQYFCKVEEVYGSSPNVPNLEAAQGEMARLYIRWIRNATQRTVTDDQCQAEFASRVSVLLFRASLNLLTDRDAEMYKKAVGDQLDVIRNLKPEEVGGATYSANEHAARVEQTATTHETAMREDGYVCGMMHYAIDPSHTVLFVFDTMVHRGFRHPQSVIQAFRSTVDNIIVDEGVRLMAVVTPTWMRPAVAREVYDTLFSHWKASPIEKVDLPTWLQKSTRDSDASFYNWFKVSDA
jgi:hypothetical protein